MAKFADRFKELIETSEYELQNVYRILNITRYQYYNWCSGRGEPDTETLKLIAKEFKVSLEWLVGASSVKKPCDHPDKDLPPEAVKMLNEYRELLRLKFSKMKKDQ